MADRVSANEVRKKLALPLPARHSLVSQTVELIRELILKQNWLATLPGEEALRTQLGISRVTLRKALAELAAQGWIILGGRGSPHTIAREAHSLAITTPTTAGKIKCLSQFPQIDLALSMRIILDEIRKNLQARGRGLDFVQRTSLWLRNPGVSLKKLTDEPDTGAWILHRASPAIQRWFQESRIPCLVLGPCHKGISLPSVQIDHAALGRHAAAEAARLGHHHIAFLVFDLNAASSIATFSGFERFAPKNGHLGKVSVINDDQTTDGLREKLASLLRQNDPPTLIMVSEAVQILPVMGILRELNLLIPQDVSLIVRDHEPFLNRCVPELSRYTFDWLRFGRTSSRILNEMIVSGGVKVVNRRFLPLFIPGQTLAPRRTDPT